MDLLLYWSGPLEFDTPDTDDVDPFGLNTLNILFE